MVLVYRRSEGSFCQRRLAAEVSAATGRKKRTANAVRFLYVPFQDVFDKAVETTPGSYFIWDNVHPTMVGHRLMADRWLDVVEKNL